MANKGDQVKHLFSCDKFEISRYSYSELETDNEYAKTQMIAYPRYHYPNTERPTGVFFQTPELQLTQYGLPKLGDYYKLDKDRAFIKVPYDPSQPNCTKLFNMLQQVDEYTLKNKDKILKDYSKLYSYQPIVREPTDQEDELKLVVDDKKKNKPKTELFKSCKFKLATNYEDGSVTTKVYVKDQNDSTKRGQEVQIKTVSDLDKYVNYNSKVRMVVNVNKLYASKAKMQKDDKYRKFGVTFKIVQMEVTPGTSSSVKEEFKNYAFLDEESEEQVVAQPDSQPTEDTKVSSPPQSDDEQQNESDDDDNDNEESEEQDADNASEPEPEQEEVAEESEEKPKGKNTKQTKSVVSKGPSSRPPPAQPKKVVSKKAVAK